MEWWLQLKDFPDYDVSNEGRIRNRRSGRILKPQQNDRGYEQISIRKNNKYHNQRVHRLVADTFFDGDHEGYDVNHIDGNKRNNHISNLEFCTRQENIRHAFDTGLKKPSRQMRVRVKETGKIYESLRECERSTGCSETEISKYLKGKRTHVKGYHFEKVE